MDECAVAYEGICESTTMLCYVIYDKSMVTSPTIFSFQSQVRYSENSPSGGKISPADITVVKSQWQWNDTSQSSAITPFEFPSVPDMGGVVALEDEEDDFREICVDNVAVRG
jgi:hypothetical protein